MKKVLFVLAVAGVMVSCGNKKKTDKPADGKDTTVVVTPPTTNPTGDVPTFADADVNAYVQAYENYISVYEKAAEGKDMSKMMELSTMGQDLGTKGMAASQKLMNNPEDAKKLADYMTARSQRIIELSKKLSGQ